MGIHPAKLYNAFFLCIVPNLKAPARSPLAVVFRDPSLLDSEPVLMNPVLQPTARSAMVVSSVSPICGDYCRIPALLAISMASRSRECTYLVQLDEHRIRIFFRIPPDDLRIGNKDIIATSCTAFRVSGETPPSFPVLFRKAVFDGKNGITIHKLFIVVDHLFRRTVPAFKVIPLCGIELRGRHIQGNGDLPSVYSPRFYGTNYQPDRLSLLFRWEQILLHRHAVPVCSFSG